ncbi:hypothetical protein OCGS_2133 [Oceaniovalibus guishaninsula JLT2003]|uniref:Uncharacterized protein n=1 Tax=Oceaniovalibus guishaninsula JLT2003 TaxID=1231392 RepID=K2HLL7_9RHOB|nr:hypothetical protein OCGS_2133 [Oceaniovalibus guishaninsula JLT2003]
MRPRPPGKPMPGTGRAARKPPRRYCIGAVRTAPHRARTVRSGRIRRACAALLCGLSASGMSAKSDFWPWQRPDPTSQAPFGRSRRARKRRPDPGSYAAAVLSPIWHESHAQPSPPPERGATELWH